MELLSRILGSHYHQFVWLQSADAMEPLIGVRRYWCDALEWAFLLGCFSFFHDCRSIC